jgi:dolichol-phosphate mannosyltransferase
VSLLGKLAAARFTRFAAVGFSGVFVNLGFLYLFAEELRLGENWSSLLAIELSILWNFLLNNAVTFRDRNARAHAGVARRLVRYNLVALVGLAIQLGTAAAMRALFMRALDLPEIGAWRYPSQLAGIALAMTWNFLSNVHWTWSQRRED